MARRTSSRAASHDQASSPPKPAASRRTLRSPQKRSTRATRSQSRDLDEAYAPAVRQGGERNERQGSVGSVGSVASTKNNGRGKKVRGNAPIQPDLSMVAEDEEIQGPLENEDEAREFPNVQQLPESMPGLSGITQSAPPTKKALLPAAQIHSKPRGKILYPRLSTVNHFAKMRPAGAAPPSNQQQLQQQVAAGPSAPKTPQNNASRQLLSAAPAKTSQEEHPEVDDSRPVRFSNEDYVNLMAEHDAEKNKENRPLPTGAVPQTSATTLPVNPQRRSFVDRQPSAHRVSQISYSDIDSQPEPTARQGAKRMREEPEELSEREMEAAVDEDEISEDDAFEQDRAQLPTRMREPPPEVIQVTGGARKRARIPSRVVSHDPERGIQSRQPRIDAMASRFEQQPGSGLAQSSNSVVSPIEEKMNDEMSKYNDAQRQAREYEAQRQVSQREATQYQASQYQGTRDMVKQQGQAHQLSGGAFRATQVRTKWTPEEEDGFLDLIARFGAGWSSLLAKGQAEGIFDDCRNQGSLKDKARNMKVDFLISRAPLPRNFNLIALGKKEKDKVLSRGQNPFRMEGEMVGQEAIDMDGHPRGVFD